MEYGERMPAEADELVTSARESLFERIVSAPELGNFKSLLDRVIEAIEKDRIDLAVVAWIEHGLPPSEDLGFQLMRIYHGFADSEGFDDNCLAIYGCASDEACDFSGVAAGSPRLEIFRRVASLAESLVKIFGLPTWMYCIRAQAGPGEGLTTLRARQ